jgi:DNA-binding CsgD family transcriptional regulator
VPPSVDGWDVESMSLRHPEVHELALKLHLILAKRCEVWQRDGLISGSMELISGVFNQVRSMVEKICGKAGKIVEVTTASESLHEFLPRHLLNLRLHERGVGMLNLFETRGMRTSVLETIADCCAMPYYFCYGPIRLKIIDDKILLVDGPMVDGQQSVMVLSDRTALAAAARYVAGVVRTAIPAHRFRRSRLPELTDRQRTIAHLLTEGQTDTAVARSLGISVRTVRYDIATLTAVLGATTRYSAGYRFAQLDHRASLQHPAD